MPLVVKDRVKETTTTTGTGTLTLLGAATGFQAFSVIGDGNTTYYTITNGTDWEVGIGTYTSSGTTLSRDTILESSNSGNAVNWGAGTKDVFVTYPAERSVYTDGAGTAITPATASVLGVASGGTGASTLTANNVLLGNGTSAVQFVAPGSSGNVLTSNGTTWTSAAAAAFDSGTLMLFQQTTAPTGWTKQTTHNNKALRVVSGTASSGGSVAFTTAFASQTPSGTVSVTVTAGTLAVGIGTLAVANTTATGTVGGTTLATSEIPAHSHTQRYSVNRNVNSIYNTRLSNTTENSSDTISILNTGGGGSHSHSFTGTAHNHSLTGSPTLSGSPSVTASSFTGNAINLEVQYVDLIIASKN